MIGTRSTEDDAAPRERGSSPTVSFTANALGQLGVGSGRAASPAKRSASELENDTDELQDMPSRTPQMSPTSSRKKSLSQSQYASPLPNRPKTVNGDVIHQDRMMVDSEDGTSTTQSITGSDVNSSTSNGFDRNGTPTASTSPSATSVEQDVASSAEHSHKKALPSYDEQIQTIEQIILNASKSDGDKGYVVSNKWINRVRARTSTAGSAGKESAEGEIGPVDNSDLVRNDHFFGDLRLASGDLFTPLRQDVSLGEQYEIVPQRAWDYIMEWYGVAEVSHVLIRYYRKTTDDPFNPNLQYELNPLICTIQKLRNDSAGTTMETLKQQDSMATSIVVSRSEKYDDFLQRTKHVAEIPETVKIRLWRLLETGSTVSDSSKMPTPMTSRGGSPAPSDRLPHTKPKLIVDPLSFTNLEEGTQRERIEVTEEMAEGTLNDVGLPVQCTLILDEHIQTSDWQGFVSDSIASTANSHGVDLKSGKEGQNSSTGHLRPLAAAGSGRRSPTPTGIMTRGRTTKHGKARGTVGLTNLGNTCYMNSALQCIRSVEELSIYFLARKYLEELNPGNPLGHGGSIAKSYESFVSAVYSTESSGSHAPRVFKSALGKANALFSGYGQQDSQEFLGFLVDGLHEDLNRIKKKPYFENPESDDNTVHDPEAVKQLGETFRSNHRARNDSVAMDLFNGFYKNTMVCPVCDKVSVTFDPYSQLTLQLPIESTFQHRFVFWPLRAGPMLIDVDIDKNASIRMLKEWIGSRVNVTAENLIICEEYSSKIYQILEDPAVISESSLQANDHLWAVELDAPASNWPPPAPKKKKSFSILSSNNEPIPDMSSPVADRMAIPLLHRKSNRNMLKVDLIPAIILITREEAKDADKILRKVLQKVQTLTSRNLFDEDHMRRDATSREDSDTEVVNGDDELSNDESRPEGTSIEGEDGLVDVHMEDKEPNDTEAPKSGSKSDVLDPEFYVFPELSQLFTIRVSPPSSGSIIPTGFNAISDTTRYETLDQRVQARSRVRGRGTSNASRNSRLSVEDTSSDEAARDGGNGSFDRNTPPDSDDDKPATRSPFFKPGQLKSIKKGRRRSKPESQDEYLIRLGEGLILDWSDDGWDQLFSGDGERGHPTNADMELLPDPELEEKKAKRAARKKHGVTLEECFEETGKSEVLSEDNAWYCGRCKELRRATKKLEIWTVPDILILHLKRFASAARMRDKIDVLVDFPTTNLTLDGKVGLPEDKSLTYDLFAVDNHYGGLGGGHYTAYAQNFFDKKWYEYNDQMVSPTKPESVVTRAAYLLFYRRRSDKPLGGPFLEELVQSEMGDASSTTLSGEESRPDEPSSNGSSEGSRAAGPGASAGLGAAANHQGAADIGLNSYRAALADIAKNAAGRGFEDDVEGDDGAPPPYVARFDEGYEEGDRDNPLPSMEYDDTLDGPFYGPEVPSYDVGTSWSWAGIDGHGTKAPHTSDNNSSTAMNDISNPDDDTSQQARIQNEFGADIGTEPIDFDNSRRDSFNNSPVSSDHVQHVSVHDRDDDSDDAPVHDIRVGSDDEESTTNVSVSGA